MSQPMQDTQAALPRKILDDLSVELQVLVLDVAYSNEELFLSNVELKMRRYASSSCIVALSRKQGCLRKVERYN
jgi:hypothetical protein